MIIVLLITGISAGVLVAAGICALFSAVGIVNRISYKLKTGNKVHLCEKFIFLGAVAGNILFVFYDYFVNLINISIINDAVMLGSGIFMGIFVGGLAMSIEEALDVPSVYFRRIGLKKHLRYVVLAIALGKLMGNYLYFLY